MEDKTFWEREEEEKAYFEQQEYYRERQKEFEEIELGQHERSIYIYCWAYDKEMHLPVKEEYEIHNFATDKTEEELENEEWLISLMEKIEKRHMDLHPNSDRYPTARIGYDNIRPSWKPKTRQATIIEYTLYTEWQKSLKTGKKFRDYKKRNQKKFTVEVD